MRKVVITIVGARPQFIKAAPVSRALAECGVKEILVHTGQHFDDNMSAVFFDELEIPVPAYNLGVHSLSHGAMTGRMLEKIEAVLVTECPDTLLIYGDTNSTLAGALAAAKLQIPVAHVEAGLRSFNRSMPEEINRVVADHLSALLFCPTETAVRNLAREGLTANVFAVGDVMYDTTLYATPRAQARSNVLQRLRLESKRYAVATVHRAENTDNPERLARIIRWLEREAAEWPIVMPAHPRTRHLMTLQSIEIKGVQIVEPLGYLDMTSLLHHAAAAYTDSGGLQKEAYFHRVPCVTLRDETEWVETIEAGWNRLWTQKSYRDRRDIGDYGDGDSAKKIASILSDFRRSPAGQSL